jgi:hypothetical protein
MISMRTYVLSSKEKNTLIVYLNQELKMNGFSDLISRLKKKKLQMNKEDLLLIDKVFNKFSSE